MKELFKNIDKTATYHINGLDIIVTIIDVRKVWGRIDYRISPVKGSGLTWIERSSLVINQ